MLSLNDRDWIAFPLTEIFPLIKRGKRLRTADHTLGNTPYVSASAVNNGVDGFIGNSKGVRKFQKCLTVANSGSVGKTFYHPYNFVASDHVTELKNNEFSEFCYKFLIPLISRLGEKYNFNHEINDIRIRREKVLLPINKQGKPDWSFMEQYVREREEYLIAEYKRFILDRYIQKEDVQVYLPSNSEAWREFTVTDLFDVTTGTENNMVALRDGMIPLISAKKTDNGLKAFVSTEKIRIGNAITWNKDGDGGAGLAYYQSSNFAADSHILILSPKITISREACIFITTALSRYYGIFGHGRANSLQRVGKTQIILPAINNGEPDWALMTEYGKALQARQIYAYLERCERMS